MFAGIYAHMCMWRPNYSLSYHFLDAIHFVLFVCSETGFSCVALTVLELLLLNSLASNSRNLPGSAARVLRFKAWATIPGHTPCFLRQGLFLVGVHQVGWVDWQPRDKDKDKTRDPLVSIFSAPRLQVCFTTPSFLCGFWGSDLGSHAYTVSTFPVDPFV